MEYSQEDIKVAPWLKSYGEVKFHLDYPDFSMSDALFESARKYPDQVALTFQDKDTTFAKLVPQIQQAEKAFRAIGIKEGDVVTICMPNMPQTVICLYAVNAIGAVASIGHLNFQFLVFNFLGQRLILTIVAHIVLLFLVFLDGHHSILHLGILLGNLGIQVFDILLILVDTGLHTFVSIFQVTDFIGQLASDDADTVDLRHNLLQVVE